jgi:hypothetical protein
MPTAKIEVTIARIETKLDSLKEADDKRNELLVTLVKTLSEQATQIAVHGQRLDDQAKSAEAFRMEVAGDVSGLEGRINVWSGANTLGAIGATVLAWLWKR